MRAFLSCFSELWQIGNGRLSAGGFPPAVEKICFDSRGSVINLAGKINSSMDGS